MDQFKIWITLGNEAMQTGDDIARALRDVAAKLEGGEIEGTIRDENGNKVGTFKLS